MIRFITRIAIPVLGIAFGFIIGCSTVSPSTADTAPGQYSIKELQRQLSKVRSSLKHKQTADLLYRKGYLLSEIAALKEPVEQRSPLYREMYRSLKDSEQRFIDAGLPSGKQKVDELLKRTWSSEHNRGVEILQADSTIDNQRLNRATVHFDLATTILPDTAISYKMKAQALYRNHRHEEALQTLEEARQRIDRLPPDMLEQLAYLYLETDRPSKAVEVYEEAESISDQNLNLMHGLANAYIQAGRHRDAVSLLNLLVENEPENIIYAQARGNQLYQVAADTLRSIYAGPTRPNAGRAFAEADSLINEAEAQYREAMQGAPGNRELKEQLAYFYNNAAAEYQKAADRLSGSRLRQAEERITYFLQSALPLFEELVQAQQDDGSSNGQESERLSTYWKNLYRIYAYLGMSEQADAAKSKIN